MPLRSDPDVIASSDLAIRVHENPASGRFYMVWSFEADAAVEEIVFEGVAGEWRMWEVKFASARDEGGGSGEDDGGDTQ